MGELFEHLDNGVIHLYVRSSSLSPGLLTVPLSQTWTNETAGNCAFVLPVAVLSSHAHRSDSIAFSSFLLILHPKNKSGGRADGRTDSRRNKRNLGTSERTTYQRGHTHMQRERGRKRSSHTHRRTQE
mmetsp:Transcript_25786/g.50487  ORF Transcript_25786/g.50487 Transcript_25786/m.50487 type:complete len:128 (-) Transcript_25786:69-452(-)